MMASRQPLTLVLAVHEWRLPDHRPSEVEFLEGVAVAQPLDQTAWGALFDHLIEDGLPLWVVGQRIRHLRRLAFRTNELNTAVLAIAASTAGGQLLRMTAWGRYRDFSAHIPIYVIPGSDRRRYVPDGERGPMELLGPCIVVGARTVLHWRDALIEKR